MAKRERKETRPLWIKKKGGGTFRLSNGYRVKPGEQFRAYESEVPQAFRDVIEKLEDGEQEKQRIEEEEQVKQEVQEKEDFTIEHRGGPWYDVKTAEGVPMNAKALALKEAEQLKEDLQNGNVENS